MATRALHRLSHPDAIGGARAGYSQATPDCTGAESDAPHCGAGTQLENED